VLQVELADAPVAVEYVPAPQLVHSAAPTTVEYFPVPQTVQRADPPDILYLPSTHTVQIPPSGPDEPALQLQFVKVVLPAGEMEFDGQALHVELPEDPTDVEYVPAPQIHEVEVLPQEATKPGWLIEESDVNSTCMYPVLDV
jgi:hypothetical protein